MGFLSETKLSEHAREPYGNKATLASYNSETAIARMTGKVFINRASLVLYAI
jgi:hypothetical protein